MSEYTPTKNEPLVAEARAFAGSLHLGKSQWRELDKAIGLIRRMADTLAAHDAEVRAHGHHVVPCARCGQRPVVASDALNSDIVVCGDCGVQIGLHELPEVRASVVPEEPEDPRKVAHIACDCVPNLGPEHCHLCSERNGKPTAWPDCASRVAVQGEPTDAEVGAALEAAENAGPLTPIRERLRASLRAAAAVREEGRGHGE